MNGEYLESTNGRYETLSPEENGHVANAEYDYTPMNGTHGVPALEMNGQAVDADYGFTPLSGTHEMPNLEMNGHDVNAEYGFTAMYGTHRVPALGMNGQPVDADYGYSPMNGSYGKPTLEMNGHDANAEQGIIPMNGTHGVPALEVNGQAVKVGHGASDDDNYHLNLTTDRLVSLNTNDYNHVLDRVVIERHVEMLIRMDHTELGWVLHGILERRGKRQELGQTRPGICICSNSDHENMDALIECLVSMHGAIWAFTLDRLYLERDVKLLLSLDDAELRIILTVAHKERGTNAAAAYTQRWPGNRKPDRLTKEKAFADMHALR